MGILQYDPKGTAKVCLPDFPHIDAIVNDASILNIIKPVDQIGNCSFSCPRRTYKSNFLSRLRIETDIFQNHTAVIVTKRHIPKTHIPPQRNQLSIRFLKSPASRLL